MRLEEKLSELRQEKGLTQKGLSAKIHVSNSSISAYETGSRLPNIEVLTAFADFFDVTTDYLLGRTDDSISPSALSEEFTNGVRISTIIKMLKMFTPEQKNAILTIIENMAVFVELKSKTSSTGVNRE